MRLPPASKLLRLFLRDRAPSLVPATLLGALLVAGTTAACTPAAAQELPPPYSAEGQVNRMEALLTSFEDRYVLLAADLFENERPYAPRANTSMLSDVRYVFSGPPFDEPAYEKERDMVAAWAGRRARFEQSLFIHTSFSTPGREHYWLRPREPVVLRGQLLRMSVWVHSGMYRHRLYFLFESASGKALRVDAGPLLWNDWKRLDLQLPKELYVQGRKADRPYEHRFTGLLIESHPLAEAGAAAIMLDNLLILADTAGLQYPGMEYLDAWGERR